jgi:hypothetical protein
MTIKDEFSSIKAVMFKTANMRLKFMPENSMKVIIKGRVAVFERDGQYQLYIDDMQPDGTGALSLAFEQLKNKLAKAFNRWPYAKPSRNKNEHVNGNNACHFKEHFKRRNYW